MRDIPRWSHGLRGSLNIIDQALILATPKPTQETEPQGKIYAGADFLEGGELGDVLGGGDDNDFLNGLAGNDTLNGGGGSDTLIGGAGADVFLFGIGVDSENVIDFVDDEDTLDLTAFGFDNVVEALDAAVETLGGGVFFDFGGGDTALINNITEAELVDDILV